MSVLMQSVVQKALDMGVPLSVQLDLTWRCNERCMHCYLDHDDLGEMTTDEIKRVLTELAASGVFFLTLSGGEIFLRPDLFEIIAHARSLLFNVKLKTNGLMIGRDQAQRIARAGVQQVQLSVYSDDPDVHDEITKVRGSLARTLNAVRVLREEGVKVLMANVLMRQNMHDYAGVQQLAKKMDAEFTLDPTITPHINGDMGLLKLRVPGAHLQEVFRDPGLVGNADEFCARPAAVDEDILESTPCSAGHTAAYISPYGDVYPCVQFPLTCGNVRTQNFMGIWQHSAEMAKMRAIRVKHLHTCSSCANAGGCTRCPGLAFMEGDMLGPSTADCEKSLARTGVLSAAMVKGFASAGLVQIQAAPTAH